MSLVNSRLPTLKGAAFRALSCVLMRVRNLPYMHSTTRMTQSFYRRSWLPYFSMLRMLPDDDSIFDPLFNVNSVSKPAHVEYGHTRGG